MPLPGICGLEVCLLTVFCFILTFLEFCHGPLSVKPGLGTYLQCTPGLAKALWSLMNLRHVGLGRPAAPEVVTAGQAPG